MPTRVLIIGGGGEEDGVAKRATGRALLWGLEQRGVRAVVHDPRKASPPDLPAYDVVLCWSYIVFRSPDYVRGALELEERAQGLGVPVVNGVRHCTARHSFFLETWREGGVACASCQSFHDFEELRLEYPLILRRDGVHQGRDVYLVRSPEQAREKICEHKENPDKAALDLAVEYVDARDENGYYNKYRSFVLGERIVPAHVFLSEHWLVNYGHLLSNEVAGRYSRDFLHGGEPNPDVVLAAARLTGSDIVALDYARRADGSYVFWEANRHFLLFEDYDKDLGSGFGTAMSVDAQARRKMVEGLGLALADLVIERAR